MILRAGQSLERRLWLGLAALALTALTLVSVLVYAMIASHLSSRQVTSLRNMTQVVNHLLSETDDQRDGERHTIRGRLDDHFAGHPDLGLRIVDSQGEVLYETPHALPTQRSVSLDFDISTPGSRYIGARARLSQDTLADEDLLRHLAWALVGASLLGALVVGFGGRLLVRRGVQPVTHLVHQICALDTTSPGPRLDGSGQPDELQPLVAHFNALLARIDGAYRQLEGFNADVAHELNTPLSTLITSSEIALRKERDPGTLRELLGSHLEELQRMSGMVEDMLFLAGVDRGAQPRREIVPSLREVVACVVDYHDASLSEYGLRAEIDGDAQGAFDVPLVKRALSNLLGNAVRYATPGSTIRIEISGSAAGKTRLAVMNAGHTLPAQDQVRVFDRLYRAEQSRARGDMHHGLGLSIVAAVARMHGGAPFLRSEAGTTCVGLDLGP